MFGRVYGWNNHSAGLLPAASCPGAKLSGARSVLRMEQPLGAPAARCQLPGGYKLVPGVELYCTWLFSEMMWSACLRNERAWTGSRTVLPCERKMLALQLQ